MAILAVGAFALGLPGLAYAADANPPERMTYQGYLVDSDGDPLGDTAPANYDVMFRIYNVKQGGLTIWGEQQTITVDNGYFSVLLGEGVLSEAAEGIETLSDVFQGDDISDRFIGITVSGLASEANVEVAPRLRLVTSPFAFTSSQARRLTDGVGNNNFFKEGSSLKLGAGANPTLTLPESGGATLEGTLTATLPGSGAGLQIDNGSNSTTLGANSSEYFELSTSLDKFLVNDDLYVKSKIYSLGTDLTLGPSNNSDTYLKIHSHSDDYIHAYADRFAVVGDDYWTEMRFSPGQADLVTSAGKFKMNKSLEVDGNLEVKGSTTFHYDLNIGGDKYLPRLIIDSTSGGDNWTAQGAAVSIGEGAAVGNAATMHMSYRGDGYGWVGAGALVNGEPSGGSARFNYLGGATVFNRDLVVYSNGGNPYLQLHSGTFGEYMQVYRDENAFLIGLNGSSQNAAWRYVYYNGDSNWDFGSDRRHKEDIKDIEPVLDRLLDVQIRRFKWKGAPSPELTDIGVIAQELEPLFPGLISKTYDEELEDDALSVGYTTFGILAVKGLQELKAEKDAENASLRQEVEALRGEVATQEDRIAWLEEQVKKISQGP